MDELRKLREEKNIAYNSTGDTWHDNPYFNKLEQDERALNTKISEAQAVLKDAEILDGSNRDMEKVDIGSIVKCVCTYSDSEEEVVFEIVGHGETDVNKGKIHYESLVAKNIIGLHLYDTVSFNTPGGETRYKVIKFYPDWNATKED